MLTKLCGLVAGLILVALVWWMLRQMRQSSGTSSVGRGGQQGGPFDDRPQNQQ